MCLVLHAQDSPLTRCHDPDSYRSVVKGLTSDGVGYWKAEHDRDEACPQSSQKRDRPASPPEIKCAFLELVMPEKPYKDGNYIGHI